MQKWIRLSVLIVAGYLAGTKCLWADSAAPESWLQSVEGVVDQVAANENLSNLTTPETPASSSSSQKPAKKTKKKKSSKKKKAGTQSKKTKKATSRKSKKKSTALV